MEGLKRDLAAGKLKPVYVVYGSEELLKREAVAAISEAALVDSPRDFNETRLHWKETEAADVISACRTFPMMGARRLVILTGIEGIKADDSKELAKYLEDPCETAVLLMVATGAPNMRLKLFKEAKKVGWVKKLDPPYQNRIPQWVQERARDKHVRIDMDAARLLGDIVGNDLAALDSSLERLILFVAEADAAVHVRLEHVEKCIARTRVHTVFDLTDALGARETGKAVRILEAMLGAREEPIRVLAMIARHLRRLWQAADALHSGASQDDVGRQLNVNGYFLRDFLRQARMFSNAEFAALLDRVYATDKLLKSSRAPAGLHMQALVLDICVES